MHLLQCILALAALFSAVQGAGLFTLGYYAYYEMDFAPSAIEYSKLTHIALGAVYTSPTGTITLPNWWSLTPTTWANWVNTVTPLAHNAGCKTVLMLGGAGADTAALTSATSVANVNTFATNLVNHAQSFQFDGIDLDWEANVDWAGMTRLAQKIRQLWPACFLTLPVNIGLIHWVGYDTDPTHYVPVMPYLDAVNMMSYAPTENSPGWDGPWHVSPLQGDAAGHPYSIKLAMDTMIARGIPKSKIGIGMAFFGSCWGSPITQPVQPQGSANLKASDNDMSYKNIEASYKPSMTQNYDNTASVPYLNSATQVGPKGCTYISYDNDQSILAKANFVKNNGLTGIIIWTVGQGILNGGTNPALNSVYTHFGRSYVPPTTTTTAATTTTTTTTTGSTTGGGTRPVVIFDDKLSSGLVGAGGANYATTTIVHTGTKSISVAPSSGTAVLITTSTRGGFDTNTITGIEFYYNGGTVSTQSVVFDLIVYNRSGIPVKHPSNPTITLSPTANTWKKGTISFNNKNWVKGPYDGFWFRGTTTKLQPLVYFDDIRVTL